jgi:hypothetical protein
MQRGAEARPAVRRHPKGLLKPLWINSARVLVMVVVVLGLSCCGGGSADGSGSTTGITPAQGVERESVTGKTGGSRGLPSAGGCGAAVVRLGRSPGAIDFVIRCRPYANATKMSLAVGLSPFLQGKGVRVRGFQRHPQVRESNSPPRHGTCRRYGGGLACAARVHSLAVVSGRLWVERGSECDARLVITESVAAHPCTGTCSSNVASAAVVVDTRPRGC